jgi:CubicO group peptidase (beta-lactamase class C family)
MTTKLSTALTSFVIAALCLFANSACAPRRPQGAAPGGGVRASTAQLLQSLDTTVPARMQQEKVPGAALAIVKDGRVIFAQGFGVTDVSAPVPVTDKTVFSVQSISKSYTTLAFLRSGIPLDDRLVTHYPAFTMKSRYGDTEPGKITFRQLLSHWAGLLHEAPLGGNYDERFATFEDHIASLRDSWMKAPVGSRYSYSNVGVDLAGYVLQLHASSSFAEVMRQEVFAPLGMTSSTFDFQQATRAPSFARGHIEEKPVPVMRIPMLPSGGMYSSAADLAKFLIYALGQPEPIRRMTQISYPVKDQRVGYGLGVEIGQLGGTRLLKHGGSGYGYSTVQAWLPEHGVGVVVLANAGDVGFSDNLAREILSQMIEASEAQPELATVIAPTLEGTWKTYGAVVTMPGARIGHIVQSTNDQLLVLNEHGVDTWFINERKGEPRGNFRSDWQRFLGSYRMGAYGNQFTTTITERNGYLVSSRNGGTKLIPHGNSLFFTPDGESVEFRGDVMLFGNRPATKLSDTVSAQCMIEWTSWPPSDRFDGVREYAQSIGSAAGMVIYDGKVLAQWGEVARKFNVHSIRKSLLSALYGTARINLSSTLEELGIDDHPPRLSKSEKQATVQDLLEATSGVFHPAAYETADMISAKPPRGSHPHGTFWLYNNWDFNALGTIYERATYRTVFQSFKHRIAESLGMEDFETSDGEYVEAPESVHPAYPLRMSARDLARFGELYRRNGDWCGRPVITSDWVKESTTARHMTNYKPGMAYGYLWWVDPSARAYFAWGTGGHYLYVVPDEKLVIVNRVNTDEPGKRISDEQFFELVRMIRRVARR